MKRILLLLALTHFATPFLSFSQSTEDFSDETISGVTITTNTGLIISSSNLDWSAYTNQLDYNNVLLSPPSPYITPSSNNDFFQITLSDQSKVFSSIEFDLWLNYGGMFGTGDMGCDCKSYTSENQLIETISKGSSEVAKNFIFNSGSIKKIICNPTNVEGGNNLHVDDIVFTIAQQENNNEILLNGTVSAENNQIKNVADPTESNDAATKSYVDNRVSSVKFYGGWHENDNDASSSSEITVGNLMFRKNESSNYLEVKEVSSADQTIIVIYSPFSNGNNYKKVGDPSGGSQYNTTEWKSIVQVYDSANSNYDLVPESLTTYNAREYEIIERNNMSDPTTFSKYKIREYVDGYGQYVYSVEYYDFY